MIVVAGNHRFSLDPLSHPFHTPHYAILLDGRMIGVLSRDDVALFVRWRARVYEGNKRTVIGAKTRRAALERLSKFLDGDEESDGIIHPSWFTARIELGKTPGITTL